MEEIDGRKNRDIHKKFAKRLGKIQESDWSDQKYASLKKELKEFSSLFESLETKEGLNSFINKRPRFDRVLYMDGEDLVLGDSLVMTVKDNTTLADIKKAIMKVK